MQLLTTKEASAQFKMGVKEFLQLPIPFVRFGKRKRRYRQEDLDQFVKSRLILEPLFKSEVGPRSRRTPNNLPAAGLTEWEEAMALSLVYEKAHHESNRTGLPFKEPTLEDALALAEQRKKLAERRKRIQEAKLCGPGPQGTPTETR